MVEGHLQQQSDERKSPLGMGLGIFIDYDLSNRLQKNPQVSTYIFCLMCLTDSLSSPYKQYYSQAPEIHCFGVSPSATC